MSREAIIIGYSGHAYVVLDTLISNNYKIKGYCDLKENVDNLYRLTYLGSENNQDNLEILHRHDVFICIGSNQIRKNVFELLLSKDIKCSSVAHPRSIISPSAQIKSGTVIMPGSVINAYVEIGNAVICNSSSIIEHECIIDDYAHIAPGAVLAGNVTVGKSTFIGANAVVKQGVKIGENVTIGAGAVVLKDVPDGALIYGNPGRLI